MSSKLAALVRAPRSAWQLRRVRVDLDQFQPLFPNVKVVTVENSFRPAATNRSIAGAAPSIGSRYAVKATTDSTAWITSDMRWISAHKDIAPEPTRRAVLLRVPSPVLPPGPVV